MISVTKLLFAREYYGDSLRYTKNAHAMRNGAGEGMGPVVVWNSTKTCNLKCRHCYMSSDNKKYQNELTTQEAPRWEFIAARLLNRAYKLGIHRIRLDSAYPLAWDLGWLLGLGVLPMLLGWLVARRPGGGGPPPGVTVALMAAVSLGAGIWAAQPPADQPFTTIVLAPGADPGAVLARAGFAQADLIWSDARVMVARLEEGNPWRLYLTGALLISGTGVPDGCFSWVRV